MTTLRKFRLLLCAVTVLGLLAATPTAALAGCLKEFGDCGDCAESAMLNALSNFDLGGAMDAYVDGIDCDIDLYHCVLIGQHHGYSCG